jgi:CHAT domain
MSVSSALASITWRGWGTLGKQGDLELSQIKFKRLPTSQFAFLSACHTATGLWSLSKEAMHLAASLQFAGFPSVIATMWGVSNEDTPIVASPTSICSIMACKAVIFMMQQWHRIVDYTISVRIQRSWWIVLPCFLANFYSMGNKIYKTTIIFD